MLFDRYGSPAVRFHAAGLMTIAGCLALGYYWGIAPVRQAQAELAEADSEVAGLIRVLPQLERQTADLQQQLEVKHLELRQQYPLEVPPGQPLLRTVSNLLATHEIDLTSLREEARRGPEEVTLVLQATSRYADLLAFIDDLRKLNLPNRIVRLSLSPVDAAGERCAANLSVQFLPRVPMPEMSREANREVNPEIEALTWQ